jgi:regulatory protein
VVQPPGQDALDAGLRALRYRDRSAHELREWLASREFSPADCEDALATLERLGLLDDRRFAEGRARALAGRGAGDALIRYDLERAGIASDSIEDALAGLEGEDVRARAVVSRRGAGPKTARYLGSKGFSPDVVAAAVATASDGELG